MNSDTRLIGYKLSNLFIPRTKILIFPAKHYQLIKNSRNLIWNKLLFNAQDEEDNCISPGLLFYYIRMPANLLANKYTLLGIMNNVRAIAKGVVPNPEGKLELYILE